MSDPVRCTVDKMVIKVICSSSIIQDYGVLRSTYRCRDDTCGPAITFGRVEVRRKTVSIAFDYCIR